VSGKFVVSLTRANDDTDRATVAFVVANTAVAILVEFMGDVCPRLSD
jgi:hypothetical protein